MKKLVHIVNFFNYYGLYFDVKINLTNYIRIRLF